MYGDAGARASMEVVEPADMIGVRVGRDDPSDLGRAAAQVGQPGHDAPWRSLDAGVDKGHLAVVVDEGEGVDQVRGRGSDAPDPRRSWTAGVLPTIGI